MTTQYATASYQEIVDIHTEADQVSVIALHTPNSHVPVDMLHGFWEQFRQFRYDGMSFSLVPAATLPSDISQVSYGAGDAPIDPRDILNPVMFHGCHGEDLGSILNGFLGSYEGQSLAGVDMDSFVSGDIFARTGTDNTSVFGNSLEALYYRCLTDNTWRKAHPQRGFRKSGLRPLVYQVVSNTPYGTVVPGSDSYFPPRNDVTPDQLVADGWTPQIGADGSNGYVESAEMGLNDVSELTAFGRTTIPTLPTSAATMAPSRRNIWFGTNRLVPLGWRDTRSPISPELVSSPGTEGVEGLDNLALNNVYADYRLNTYHTVDKAYMGIILLPPAYKAEQYMRLIINHRFSFRRFRGAGMDTAKLRSVGYAPTYQNLN